VTFPMQNPLIYKPDVFYLNNPVDKLQLM